MPHDATLTVGFDGSRGSRRALDWAAAEAVRRGASLQLVACYTAPVMAEPWYVPPAVDIAALREVTTRLVTAAATAAEATHPAVRVEAVARLGSAAPELIDAARDSDLLVVGTHGHGRFDAWRLGSVAVGVARHAPCPVVVVPDIEPRPPRDRVVVGVDGSEASRQALRWAGEEAERRAAELLVVHVWDYPYATELGTPTARDMTRVDGALTLEAAVRDARHRFNSPVVDRLVQGRPASELTEASRDADLIVIGSHGRGAVRSLLFGSVSHEVSSGSACPTVIVRGEREHRDGDA